MNIQAQYDKIGKEYLSGQKVFFSEKEDIGTKFILKSLPSLEKKRILDIGCGNGKDMLLLESLGASQVYGLDPSAFMVAQAKKTIVKSENVVLGSIEETNFEDESFDIAIARFSVHHLSSLEKAYNEISRILKKSGLLIFVVHHPFRDVLYQEKKIYGKQEIIKIELYDNKVPIYFPTHTLKDYLSQSFLRISILQDLRKNKV